MPGAQHPRDLVKVQIDAQRHGATVISDAATFRFVTGHTEQLEFVLYRACLGRVDCAAVGQSCNAAAACETLTPQPFHGLDGGAPQPPPDLASEGGPDLATPPDLTTPRDLTSPPADLADTVPLTVTLGGSGSGTVSVGSASCTASVCVFPERTGSGVTLVASPAANNVFVGWSGACIGTSSTCMLTMSAPQSATATFKPFDRLTVVTMKLSNGNGAVVPSPAGASCGTNCWMYAPGSSVMLSETPTAGSFVGWSAGFTACKPSSTTCTVMVNGDTPVIATFGGTIFNYAFVTSTTYPTASLNVGGNPQLQADSLCAQRASAAGMPSVAYKAWLSTAATSAATHLGTSARGWVRTDGLPFADTLAGFQAGAVLYPLALDENGAHVVSWVWTGSLADGTTYTGATCGDWTLSSSASAAEIGTPIGGTLAWTQFSNAACNNAYSLYCFGTASANPLAVAAVPNARRAFVTSGTVIGSAGIAAPDALCASEATSAGLGGTWKAYLSTSAADGLSRFDLTRDPWARADGVLLAPMAAQTSFSGVGSQLLAPLGQLATGSYVGSFSAAWVGSATSNCNDWTSMSVGVFGTINQPTLTGGSSANGCNGTLQLYCLQQ